MVSEKLEQEIVFDQNLTNIPATTPYVLLSWLFSKSMDGNLTQLP